jgi:alkylated DNA nucleotide flippase Atl1
MTLALRKSMPEKIDNAPKDLPKVVADPRGRGEMLVPSPKMIEKAILEIPKGKVTTAKAIKEKLAKSQKADFTCPLSSGWFFKMVSECAEEERAAGKKNLAPWWRVVLDDGSPNPKFPNDGKLQTKLLEQEGIKFKSGKVRDLEKNLV